MKNIVTIQHTNSYSIFISPELSRSGATRLMLLPFLNFYFVLPAISPRPLKGSKLNFSRRRQIGWNIKRGVKLLKSVRGQDRQVGAM